MSARAESRGGAPVGHVDDLDPFEALALLYLRLWQSSGGNRTTVRDGFASAFGGRDGETRLRLFDSLLALLSDHARRPMVHHAVQHRFLGADESAYANLIGAAAAGDREEAALVAALILRADMAMIVADQAVLVAMSLRQMLPRAPAHAPEPHDDPRTTHQHRSSVRH